MPIFTKNDVSVFFSHIPKTGGSSAERFLFSNGYRMSFTSRGIEPCSLQHRHNKDPELLAELLKVKPIYKFTIIRHPVDRAISNFFNTRESRLHQITTSEDFHNWVTSTLEEYKTNNFVADNHIRPQVEFLHEGIDIYTFGQWDKLCDGLANHCEINTKYFPHVHKGTSNTTSSDFCKDVLNWTPKEKTIEILKDFYKEDFKLFFSIV